MAIRATFCYLAPTMEKTFKSCDRKQMLLLPPSLLDWLPEGHLAHFIMDVEMDLSAIYSSYEGDGRGHPPYDPRMMTALLFYGYCTGVPSSRQIEKRTYEDVAFRVIAANRHPDHDSICEFRKRHLRALAGLFVQILRLCQEAGLVKLGHMALDGTKIKANASKHKTMSYGRMKKKKEELEKEIDELLKNAESVDKEEDRKYGKGKKGWDLPDELKRRETRLAKIKEAMSALEKEARKEASEKKQAASANSASEQEPQTPSRPVEPSDKAQRNFTDPDSRIMKMSSTNSFEQCYNAQAMVDDSFQVIVAANLSQRANDSEEVEPILDILEENLGGIPFRTDITADAGYFSETNVMLFEDALLDPFIATQKMKHGEVRPGVRGRLPKDITPKERMTRKISTKRGHEIYSKRKSTVEPVFGQIKQARGLRQFLLRGYGNVSAEWQLWCLSHNLLKLYRHGGPF
jgi:transposase